MRSGFARALSLLVLCLLPTAVFSQGAKISQEGPAEPDRPQERARWFLRGRSVDGKPATKLLRRAYEQKLNNRILQGSAGAQAWGPRPRFVNAPAGSPPWNFLGPAPTATAAFNDNQQNYGPAVGRVTAVVVDQSDVSGNTVYVGGASGGVWRTTNAVSAPRSCDSNGVCTAPVIWTPLTDGEATLTVGSIALQPANGNLILVGTGEANNSADSYYGMGILRSSDGGASWTLISSATCPAANPSCPSTGNISLHGLGFTRIAFSTDNRQLAVATAAAASGGLTVGAESGDSICPLFSPTCPRGIYYTIDAGVTWSRANLFDGSTIPDAGSANSVVYNSVQKKFYANIRYHGFYASSDGANWTRLTNQPGPLTLAACPSSPANSSCPLYRAEMAVAPGRDEMYVWIYDSNEVNRGIFQTKDGGQSWTQLSTAGIDNCGDSLGCGDDQGTYNLALAAVPNATATDLYAGGVNVYKCTISPINPTCAASQFTNLTHVYGCSPTGAFAHVHPDQHAIDLSVANPRNVFFGNDGGVYRTLDGFTTNTASCSGKSQLQLQFDNLNTSSGFSMLQFVGFSHAANDVSVILGGTQDNGSPAVSSASPSSGRWVSVNNGDGGFTAVNPLNANEWFTSNPAPLTQGGGIQRCTNGVVCTYQSFSSVVTQDKIGGDNSPFYTFFTLDPQASSRMLVGSCRVWRGNSDGTGSDWSVNSEGGTPLSQDFVTGLFGTGASCSAGTPYWINTIAAGGVCAGACDPGITPVSGSGGGSRVVWAGMEGIADSTRAAVVCPNGQPCGGHVWTTANADADLALSKWVEVSGLGIGATPATSSACTLMPSVCNINPKHYPISGIALEPHDATGQTAYVTVMGFGVGHVFKTTNAGGTWARLDGDPSGTGLPDAPADAIVADPNVANLVYVGTDVGIFSSRGDGTWTEFGPPSGPGSLPNVPITQLKIYNNPNDSIPLRLRASTYGRGIWEISISPVAGYTLSVSNPTLFAFAGKTGNYTGTITLFNGYNAALNVSCTAGGTSLPTTCPKSSSPVVIANPAANGNFLITAGDSAVGDFSFMLAAVGADPKNLTQQVPVALHSVDFSLGQVSASTVAPGNAADVTFNVRALGQFTGDVMLTCPTGLPGGTSCHFAPAVVSLTPGAVANVRLTIPTTTSTATGSYTVEINGTSVLDGASQTHSTPLVLTISSAGASQGFTIATGPASPAVVKASQNVTLPVTISSQGAYSGTLTLSCSLAAGAGSSCDVTPPGVALTPTVQTAFSILTVNSTGATAGTASVTAGAFDAATHSSASATASYSVMDYSVALSAPASIVPGSSTSTTVITTAQNGYTGLVNVSCNVPSPLSCALARGQLDLASTTTASTTVTITAPANTPAGNYAITVATIDASITTLNHMQSTTLTVSDFTSPTICNANTGGCSSSAIVSAGSAASFRISVVGLGTFGGAVTLACASGLPSLATCAFSPNPVNPGSASALNIMTTAPSVGHVSRPMRSDRPLYALWLAMPGLFGIVWMLGPARERSQWTRLLGLLMATGLAIACLSCGGGGGSTSTAPPIPKAGTPAGTYTIVVTGSSGSGVNTIQHSTNITLTVN